MLHTQREMSHERAHTHTSPPLSFELCHKCTDAAANAPLLTYPRASTQTVQMPSPTCTDAQLLNSVTSSSVLPLGSVLVHKPRRTAGSARFFSGEPMIRPCTRRLSLSLAPLSFRMTSDPGWRSSPSTSTCQGGRVSPHCG